MPPGEVMQEVPLQQGLYAMMVMAIVHDVQPADIFMSICHVECILQQVCMKLQRRGSRIIIIQIFIIIIVVVSGILSYFITITMCRSRGG